MTTIVTRAGKGSPLTHTEVDTNFTNLNTNKLEAGAIALGSAATPSISFTGDTNTGIYSPGADQLAVATNGVQRINIEADGDINIDGGGVFYDATNNRLAIGSTSPSVALEVSTSSNLGSRAIFTRPDVSRTASIGANRDTSDCPFVGATSNTSFAFITNDTERARIDSSGRLLVGTSSATGANLLQVNSDALINGHTVGRGAGAIDTNTAIGGSALSANTTGSLNTANGLQALASNTTGSNNTANGLNALYSNLSGSSNTAIGMGAGYFDNTTANTTGSNNTFIGKDAVGASSSASNVITLGNSSIATLRCQVTTITSLSDARDKTNITTLPAGLDFINALRPVAFDWNTRDGARVGIHEFGFIAQELQEAQTNTGITVPNLVYTENPDKLEASPGVLLPILINAVKQLSAQNTALETRLAALEAQ